MSKPPFSDQNIANHLFQLDSDELNRPAIIDADWNRKGEQIRETSWSFKELQSLSRQCMTFLLQQDIQPGDRVLLMVRPGFELIVLCFALFRLKTIPIVIDPGMGLGKFRRAVIHSRPDALVGIPIAHRVSRLFKRSFSSIRKRAVIKGSTFISALRRLDGQEIDERFATNASDLAAILFTSGSTGAPKGVCYEHGMFDAQLALLRERFCIQRGEVDLPMLPIFALFNPALGMTTVIPQINPSRPATVDPRKIVAAIQTYGVTNTFGSPVLWRKIGDYCLYKGIRLPSLKRILVAGAAAPTQLYEDFQKILSQGQMVSPYGATECLPVSVIEGKQVLEETSQKTNSGHGICVGKVLPGVQVRIIRSDTSDLSPLPDGEIGEILVTGPSVTKCYDQLPDVTEATKIWVDGTCWHRMGDLGYLDADGNLWFCGRKVEQVETPDGVLYTEPVEALFLQHSEISRCALIQLENEGAIVLQPKPEFWPGNERNRKAFVRRMMQSLRARGVEPPIRKVFFHRQLPVDVRHNAKIHRLTLARHFSKKTATTIENEL
jgi:acyl-CoA synthetase (AMP-forming)/AMP-acid ligase II